MACDAKFLTGDDRELVCALEPDHDGPVHQTADGEAWGDQNLSRPLPPDAPDAPR